MQKYWAKRAENLEKALLLKGRDYYYNLAIQYDRAARNIEKEIEIFFRKYANNNQISLAEAKKTLQGADLKIFKMDIKEYIEKSKALKYNKHWLKELENASMRFRISRLEALKLQMRQEIESLSIKEIDGLRETLKDVYSEGYYKNIYNVQKDFGLRFSFAKLDTDKINKVISKPWAPDGSDFSERIWGEHRPKLIQALNTDFTQSIIRGEDPKKIIKKIVDDFGVAKSRASNLIQTETAFFASESSKDSFKEIGIEKYQIVATLDNRTSDICQSMDGKVFPMSAYEVSVTAPPFHNRCRTTFVPIVDKDLKTQIKETRAAKNRDGRYIRIPSNMTYVEWKEKYL